MASDFKAFFRSLGSVLFDPTASQVHGWPRVRASCDYHAPLRFGETVEVHLYVKEIKIRALTYFFRFRKILPDGSAEPVARGEITVVCATMDQRTRQLSSRELPAELLSKIQVANKQDWST